MADRRSQLPVGTLLKLESGSIYTISGEALGFGGGSIIYPARRMVLQDGILRSDGFDYVVKECYPASADLVFLRSSRGEILPETDAEEAREYLRRARQMQLEEGDLSRQIYRTASRINPIRESSLTVGLTLPGQEEALLPNTVTVMESLTEKGRPLSAWIRERRQFAPWEAFRILQQVLFSLREVHQAGYLHLDIQDGNVFLRGTLTREDTSELVTLLDFGSARPMTEGKTLPIRDRVIFTSQGFSAPEILLHNDGNLCLGVEADLYSVGCLGLYLLTGRRADSRLLLADTTGSYLKPNQLRRMKCPRHLVDRIQQILARALEKEPENRYHSASEMLADVTDLADALQPYRTDLRNVTYDAFVCYKHGETDSAAALELQRRLEQFRAPRGISEARRPFRRVFVDEGELSSCADFGQQIREALKNSGWLIVVCSPDTPLSPWVQLEIDTFLEYHDRSRILAVLTGGDETVSFPPQLRGDARGHGQIFASDARGDSLPAILKKLRGDALLRLVAPMLGSTFDTLKQRQKAYLFQKIAAVTAFFMVLAVSFAAYAMNRAAVIADQARRIEEEYRNTLLNESRFLLQQAERQLDDSDPLGALELALAALPSGEQDRPVLTEAEYLLSRALGVYATPESAGKTMTPVGMIRATDPTYFLDDTGSFLFTIHSYMNGKIQVWDTRTMTLCSELVSGSTYSTDPVFARGDTLVLKTFDRAFSVNHRTGVENWSVSMPSLERILATPDRSTIITLSDSSGEGAPSITLDLLSAETGALLRTCSFAIDENQTITRDFCVSEDLKWVAVCTNATDIGDILDEHHSVYLLNLETGTGSLLFRSDTMVAAMAFAGDRLAVIRDDGYTLTTNSNKIAYSIIPLMPQWYELYDPADGSRLWSKELLFYPKETGLTDIRTVADVAGIPALLYLNGDRCTLLSREDGALLRNYTLQSSAMDIKMTEDGIETVNSDGSFSRVRFHNNNVVNYRVLDRPVSAVFRCGEVLYLQSSPDFTRDYTIRKYVPNKYDDGYILHWETGESGWKYCDFFRDTEGLKTILTADRQVCIVNLTTGESRTHTIDSRYPFSSYDLLGLSEDCRMLYWDSYEGNHAGSWITGKAYYQLDLATGRVTELSLPSRPENLACDSVIGFFRDSLLFLAEKGEDFPYTEAVYAWNLRDGTLTEFCPLAAPGDLDSHNTAFGFHSGGTRLQYAVADYLGPPRELVWTDLVTGQTVHTPIRFPMAQEDPGSYWDKSCYHWNDAGTMAVFSYGGTVYVVDQEGALQFRIPLDSGNATLQFSPDGSRLYLIDNLCVIYEYRISDGVCTNRMDLNTFTKLSFSMYDASCYWLTETTMLIFDGTAGFLVDISGETMVMKAVVDHCCGYDTEDGRFLTVNSPYSVQTLGSLPRYTVEELMQMANTLLNRDN